MEVQDGLEPTYEGLKHHASRARRGCLEGLEPTYEGLKLHRGIEVALREKRLEPTYEGLKHFGTIGEYEDVAEFGAYL